jgi:hypothetical protein
MSDPLFLPMWIRMTPDEYRKQYYSWRKFVFQPVVVSSIAFALASLKGIAGPKPGTPVSNAGYVAHSYCEAVQNGAIWAALVGIVCLLLEIAFRRPLFAVFRRFGAQVVICSKCFRVKNRNSESNCACGGEFEDIEHWKWIDDCSTKPG